MAAEYSIIWMDYDIFNDALLMHIKNFQLCFCFKKLYKYSFLLFLTETPYKIKT